MAITKIKCLKAANGASSFKQSTSLRRCLEYIMNREKTNDYYYVSGYNCNYLTAYQEMMNVKKINNKTWGRQGYHFIISFSPEDNVDEEKAYEFMNEFCFQYLKKDYQAVFAIHNDQNHLHAHLVFNSVSMMTGLKYRYNKGDWKRYIQPIVNDLCEKYDLSTISLENEKKENLSYEKWKAQKNGARSWGDIYREDIDRVIGEARSFEEFVTIMIDNGYEIKNTGKYFGIRTKSVGNEREHKFRRLYKLGDQYSVDAIKKRIAENCHLQNNDNLEENEDKQIITCVFPTIISCKVNCKSGTYFNYKEYQYINPLKSRFVKRLYDVGCFRSGKIQYSNPMIRYDMRHIENLNKSIDYICTNKIDSIDKLKKRIDDINNKKKDLYKRKKELLNAKKLLSEDEPDIYKGQILNVSREIDKCLKEVKICIKIKTEYDNDKNKRVRR